MFPIQDQISVTTRSTIEAQLAMLTSLTDKTFESIEKLVNLNINAVKATLAESNAATKQLLIAKDPQEFFSLSAAQAQPAVEKALAYGRHLATIASSTQAEFAQAAEAQLMDMNRKVSKLIDAAAKNAPAGSENAIGIMKTAIENATVGYEQLTRTTKQAMEAVEANMTAAVSQFAPLSKAFVLAK